MIVVLIQIAVGVVVFCAGQAMSDTFLCGCLSGVIALSINNRIAAVARNDRRVA